jgi:hypothetical protein
VSVYLASIPYVKGTGQTGSVIGVGTPDSLNNAIVLPQALLTLQVEHGDATTPTSELGIPLKQRREARQYLCVPPLALLVLTKRVRASTASRCRCSFHPRLSWKAVCRWVEAHRARHQRVTHRYWEFWWRRIEIDV